MSITDPPCLAEVPPEMADKCVDDALRKFRSREYTIIIQHYLDRTTLVAEFIGTIRCAML
jgi:hypothetical protein